MIPVSFNPYRIFVDRSVISLPMTQQILGKFSSLSPEILDDPKILKKTAEMTWAKKSLLLTRMKADPIKEFRAMTPALRSLGEGGYYSLDLISNCHLECTYCILNSYLENNPLITIYTNIEEVLEKLQQQMVHLPEGSIIGTGKIADSLALDSLTEHSRQLIPFFAQQTRVILELKTKSAEVAHLLDLPHEGQTVVSWSMNPPTIIEREEYKTASFKERLRAASRVVERGYRVGFHFDPMIVHAGWQKNYREAIRSIFAKIPSSAIAWMSVGTLRFPARQARIMKKRFPKNQEIHEGLISTNRIFLHYPDDLREEMQSWMEENISQYLEREKVYRCMDS